MIIVESVVTGRGGMDGCGGEGVCEKRNIINNNNNNNNKIIILSHNIK